MRLALSGKTSPVVFDVGANEGQWVSELLAACPSARVHAFEPQKILAQQLEVNYPGVTVNNLGLGNESGVLELFDYADRPGSQHASLLAGVIDVVHQECVKSQKVRVITIDEYCVEKNIKFIDFLKIDVEGFELKVLEGAKTLLREGGVDVIQFEFTHINLLTKTFMQDFYECLSENYSLYRLLPHGLFPFDGSQSWLREQFAYQNIIAICKTRRASVSITSEVVSPL